VPKDLDKLSMKVRDRRTAKELVTDTLREAILNGYFVDGEPIEIGEIAAKFGVSRMPVRVALQQLESEGLVDIQPHKKPIAVSLSPEEVRNIGAIRCELEALAIRLTVQKISQPDIEKLDRLVQKMENCSGANEFITLNTEFHNMICQLSENDHLNAIIVQLRNNVERYLRIYMNDFSYPKTTTEEHRLIVKALTDRNEQEADRCLRTHLSGTCNAIAEFLEKKIHKGK
jgi:DNA-binding GntR family transcriptional regulator